MSLLSTFYQFRVAVTVTVRVCVCVCVRACVRACVLAVVRARAPVLFSSRIDNKPSILKLRNLLFECVQSVEKVSCQGHA